MEYVGISLGIIVSIVIVVLLIKLIKFLFTNFIISRIFSIGNSVAALIIALSTGEEVYKSFVPMLILTTLSWLFFIGPVVFDVEWDGTFDLDFDSGEITAGTSGGFLMNTFISLIICGGSYMIFGSESPVVFFLFPIALLVGNAIFIFVMVRNIFW